MESKHQPKLTIIMPAFNEAASIERVIMDVKSVCSDFLEEIIVIDDGSHDATIQKAKQAGARVIQHYRNLGYGASLKTGIRAAKTDLILTMDSDGQHLAEDIVRLWEGRDGQDMVVGERTQLLHSSLWRMPGKWLLGLMADYLTQQKIPDLNSGLRIMQRDIIARYLHLCPSGFSFSTTCTMVFFNRGYQVKYIPIKSHKRKGKSTVSLGTGLNAIILILRISTLFNPLKIFIPLSTLFGLAALVIGTWYFMAAHTISGAPLLLFITATLLFAIGLISDQISQLRLERYE
jgi:glycosyltransferase involved in cell wall biosynthesis